MFTDVSGKMYPSQLQGPNNSRRLRDLRIWDTDVVPQRQQENTNLHYVTCQKREGLTYKAAAADHAHLFLVHIITTGKYEVRSGRRTYGS
jgi:hypothetical protein